MRSAQPYPRHGESRLDRVWRFVCGLDFPGLAAAILVSMAAAKPNGALDIQNVAVACLPSERLTAGAGVPVPHYS